MLLRKPHDLAGLFRDGRARVGWSQNELAETVGVSRQWISLVERGKTSVEFDLVVAALQALGYRLHVETSDLAPRTVHDLPNFPRGSVHESSQRTRLTRHGESLGTQRTRRMKRDRDE
jgi:y4mF family transcriptional regulator